MNVSQSLLKITLAIYLSVVMTANQAQSQEASFGSQAVTDSITMLYSKHGFTGGNIAISSGQDGLVMIDNGMPNILDKLRAEIEKISDAPVDYLISTHVHGDHTGNNAAFGKAGTRLISHRNLRANMRKNGVGNSDEFIAAPVTALAEITFNDQMTLNVNGDAMRLIHLPNAHTDGDSIIYFENANVIHTGDIYFNNIFPYIDTDNGGSLDGLVAALEAINKLANNDTKIIPGHGPLATKTDLATNIAMLKDAKAIISAQVAAGKSNEQIQDANLLEKYKSYHWGFITTEIMTKQLIQAARGT